MDENILNRSPMENPPEISPKGSKKTLRNIIIIAAVVIALAAGTVCFSLFRSPIALLSKAFSNTAEAMADNAVVPFAGKLAGGGSMELSTDLDTLLPGYGIEGTASVKLYVKDSASLAAKALVDIGSKLSLDATVFYDGDNMALSSDALLGSEAYGIKLDELAENFESSPLGPNGDYSLGIDAEELETALKPQTGSAGMEEQASAIISHSSSLLMESLINNTQVKRGRGSLDFGSGTYKTTAVIFSTDARGLCNILTDLLTYLRDDEDIRSFIKSYDEYMSDVGSYVPAYLSESLEKLFYESIDEALADLEELRAKGSDENLSFELIFHISKSGNYLMGVDMLWESDADSFGSYLVFGPDPTRPEELRFRIGNAYRDISGSYVVRNNDSKSYESAFSLSHAGNAVISADIFWDISANIYWDKESGELNISALDEDGEELKLSALLKADSEECSLEIKTLELFGEQKDYDISLMLRAADEIPTMPEYTDIFTLKNEDIEDMIADFREVLLGLLYLMY